jgi:hypothetical protein
MRIAGHCPYVDGEGLLDYLQASNQKGKVYVEIAIETFWCMILLVKYMMFVGGQ